MPHKNLWKYYSFFCAFYRGSKSNRFFFSSIHLSRRILSGLSLFRIHAACMRSNNQASRFPETILVPRDFAKRAAIRHGDSSWLFLKTLLQCPRSWYPNEFGNPTTALSSPLIFPRPEWFTAPSLLQRLIIFPRREKNGFSDGTLGLTGRIVASRLFLRSSLGHLAILVSLDRVII